MPSSSTFHEKLDRTFYRVTVGSLFEEVFNSSNQYSNQLTYGFHVVDSHHIRFNFLKVDALRTKRQPSWRTWTRASCILAGAFHRTTTKKINKKKSYLDERGA